MGSFEDRVRRTFEEASRAAQPPPDIDISTWAEQHRILGHSSRLSGPYRAIRTPYLRELMNVMSPRSTVQMAVFQKPTQIGATEALLCVLGFYLHLAPTAILCVQPSVEMARRFSRQRLAEMIDLCPALKASTSTPRGGKLPNSALYKATTNGAALVLTGANSASALRALPARIVLLDEVDAYPGDLEGEGDPVDLACQRAESYGTSKRILVLSTPTEEGQSRIARLFSATDRRKYHVPCPRCGAAIVLEFPQLHWKAGDNVTSYYRCQICDRDIDERDKLPMIEAGFWRATSTCDPDTAGFHLNQLASPWTAWRDLLRRSEAAQGVPEKLKTFLNTALAEVWSPPSLEVPEAAVLQARAEPYPEGVAPAGACFLTMGVDCQNDRLECELVGWGKDAESWSIGYYTLHGDISEPHVWAQLDELLNRTWKHVSGMELKIQCTAIDAGFRPAEVTQFTRGRYGQRVFACKGLSVGWGKSIWPRKATWDRNKHAIFLVSSDESKAWTMNRLRIAEAGPGFCHFPLSRPAEWYEMFTAEKLIFVKGARKWVNSERRRNEATDARMLAVCALHSRLLAGLNLNAWCDQFEALLHPPNLAEVPKPNGAPSVIRSRFVWG